MYDTDLDSKVIWAIGIMRLNLHTISNHCVKYEYPQSLNRRGVVLRAVRQILRIFDLDTKTISLFRDHFSL